MGRLHEDFEWDPEKAEANAAKHDVTFHDAGFVLLDEQGDRFHWELHDDRHAEDRWITIASDPEDRSLVYVIVWTPRGDKTRIISARYAEASERRLYEQYLTQQTGAAEDREGEGPEAEADR